MSVDRVCPELRDIRERLDALHTRGSLVQPAVFAELQLVRESVNHLHETIGRALGYPASPVRRPTRAVNGTSPSPSRSEPRPRGSRSPARKPSETLASIAAQYDLSVQELRDLNPDLNDLEEDEPVPKGSSVRLRSSQSPARMYDTIRSIARAHSVCTRELVAHNEDLLGYHIDQPLPANLELIIPAPTDRLYSPTPLPRRATVEDVPVLKSTPMKEFCEKHKVEPGLLKELNYNQIGQIPTDDELPPGISLTVPVSR